jgi:hypothetical protein
MLDQIGRKYKQLKQQLNEIDLQLNTNQLNTNQLKTPTRPSRVLPSQRHSEPAVPDCSIFQNEAASRDLMNRDSATWLKLYAACGKQK